MDETYASNVENLNQRLREYKQSQVDKASSLNESARDKFNQQLSEYQDKWKAVQDGGQDEAAALMGLKGTYAAGKKVYDIYKKYKGKDAEGDEEDDGTKGGEEGDPQGEKLDGSNPAEPLSEDDKAFLQDPMKDMREARQGIQSRMNSRLKDLGYGEDETSAPSASGSAAQAPADTGGAGGTDDASVSQARATAEGADTVGQGAEDPFDFSFSAFDRGGGAWADPSEQSAFGDLSNIPKPGTASSVLQKLDAQAATERGGNIGKGASDAVKSTNAPTPEGTPASGQATEGGNTAPAEQSSSGYRPEGDQSRTLDQGAGSESVPKTADGGSGSLRDADPLDSGLPEEEAPALEEGGGFLADLGATEAATAAIPFVGEAAALVGGFVAIGEGIYHLFHPPHKKLPAAPIAGSQVPQSVQAKYANALPSFDSSSDNIASDAVF